VNINITSDDDAVVLNELGPVLAFSIAFLVVMGGIAAYAYAICRGRVNLVSLDFWKGIGKIQCK
jgi:hypothetical protein